MTTQQVAQRLVELCRAGEFQKAKHELFADDAVSIEPENRPPGSPVTIKGMDALLAKSRQFEAGVETVHGVTCSEPAVAGNWLSLAMGLDVTM